MYSLYDILVYFTVRKYIPLITVCNICVKCLSGYVLILKNLATKTLGRTFIVKTHVDVHRYVRYRISFAVSVDLCSLLEYYMYEKHYSYVTGCVFTLLPNLYSLCPGFCDFHSLSFLSPRCNMWCIFVRLLALLMLLLWKMGFGYQFKHVSIQCAIYICLNVNLQCISAVKFMLKLG
jgi:hypothetical protein